MGFGLTGKYNWHCQPLDYKIFNVGLLSGIVNNQTIGLLYFYFYLLNKLA